MKYRFFLSVEGGAKSPARPIYGDSLSLDYSLETGQQFYRQELNGNLQFVRQDYDMIMSAAFDDKFIIEMEKTEDGIYYESYWKGYFYRANCTIDEDNKKITVQPRTIDDYDDIIAGLDKEYNLIDLAPSIVPVIINKRPILQVYVMGENTITNILGKMSWEQNIIGTPDKVWNSYYHFSLNEAYVEIYVNDETVGGLYAGYLNRDGNTNNFYGTIEGSNDDYQIEIAEIVGTAGTQALYTIRLKTYDGELLYEYSSGGGLPISGILTIYMHNPDNTKNILVSVKSSYVFSRVLMYDVESLLGNETSDIPSDDIIAPPTGYNKVIGYAVTGTRYTTAVREAPTKYGQNPNGKYFTYPYSIYDYFYVPVGQSSWWWTSIWFQYEFYEERLEQEARNVFTLRDANPLYSVISVLLQQVAPNITHEGTQEYSRFFYGEQNPITERAFSLLLTQKSNVLVGEYQNPAKVAKITLGSVLSMLSGAFQCYWHVQNGKLIIEHISWYRNGGTYNGTLGVGSDFTKLINLPNRKPWSFATSNYSYDMEDMPERIQAQWMDESSIPFNGVPIVIQSGYAQKGNIEEITIGNFTSDVDMMMATPELFSREGFALMCAILSDDVFTLPIERISVDGIDYLTQNTLASMAYLQEYYWRDDLPARHVTINGKSELADGLRRTKLQELTAPALNMENELYYKVRTNIGDGHIKELSVNLSSRTAKITLGYEPE